jgi:hypothetical protein
MRGGRLVVVDWTRRAALVGVFSESARGWQLESGLDMTPRLAVRHDEMGGLRVLAGEEASAAHEDESTLIFEQPARDLPRMEDAELQTLLLNGFWRGVAQGLVARGLLRAGEQVAGYVVPSHRFPLPLLESFRASCAGERPLKLIGIAHEAAALVLGFLRSEAFQPEESAMQSGAPITICLAVACDEQAVDVACFDYARATPTQHRILIRDFFQTTCADLSARLHDCDWLGAFSLLVIVEDPVLPASAQSAFRAPLQAIADGVAHQHQQTPVASELKLRGGAHVALCASGRAPDEQEYDVAHACHIGVQIDQQHFQPVVSKEAWIQLTEFPYFAAQAFHLRGRPGNALRLNLYGGYSTRVSDAVPLGHAMLWQEDLARLTDATALTAAIRLDAPGSGEFLLGLMPENHTLRRQPFTLPGLVV